MILSHEKHLPPHEEDFKGTLSREKTIALTKLAKIRPYLIIAKKEGATSWVKNNSSMVFLRDNVP
jgi:hypothetical protein